MPEAPAQILHKLTEHIKVGLLRMLHEVQVPWLLSPTPDVLAGPFLQPMRSAGTPPRCSLSRTWNWRCLR